MMKSERSTCSPLRVWGVRESYPDPREGHAADDGQHAVEPRNVERNDGYESTVASRNLLR